VQSTQAIAYGTFNLNAAPNYAAEIVIEVFHVNLDLGDAREMNVGVAAGGDWQISVTVKQGFGAPTRCGLGLY
jgi:hypothetical protein